LRASVEVTEAGSDCAAVDETYRRIVSRRGFVDRSEQPASMYSARATKLSSISTFDGINESVTPLTVLDAQLNYAAPIDPETFGLLS
jgi:hypothetical protein